MPREGKKCGHKPQTEKQSEEGIYVKAEILSLLREKADYVSGQELCEYFGVSRTAVWKAIGCLRQEGYQIDAVQNRGYRLTELQTVYGQNDIASRLQTKRMGRPVCFYENLGSTNVQAKLLAEEGAPEGALVVAEMQTAGRGRRGRDWESPANTNVYFTLILRPDFSPDKASMLTLVMGMAVAEGIRKTLPEKVIRMSPPGIKWPNDLVVNGKKICGILTEMSMERDYIQYLVIGVGINVGKQDYGPELAQKATNLETEYGVPVSRSILIANVMEAFEEKYDCFLKSQDMTEQAEEYNAMVVNRDREVGVLDPKGEYRGIARGINAAGELLVEMPDGSIREVYAGEVSVRGIYGYV